MGVEAYPASSLSGGVVICTSSTRPAGVAGMTVYETDTHKIMEYDGTQWNPPWNLPWGILATATITSNPSNLGTTAVPGTAYSTPSLSITFTAVANRYVRLTLWNLILQGASGTILQCSIVETTSGATEIVRATQSTPTVNTYMNMIATKVITPTAGSHTYTAYGRTDVGSATVQGNAAYPPWIVAEDIGPNGSPT